MEIAFVDQGDTGEDAAEQASKRGIRLEVVKHAEPAVPKMTESCLSGEYQE